jgi:hypothetical protein
MDKLIDIGEYIVSFLVIMSHYVGFVFHYLFFFDVSMKRPEYEMISVINWPVLFANIACVVFIFALIDSLFKNFVILRYPRFLLAKNIIFGFVLAFTIATITTKNYWGYYFTRPNMLLKLSEIKNIEDVVHFKSEKGKENFESLQHAVNDKSYIKDLVQDWKERPNSYYNRDGQIFAYLSDKGLLDVNKEFPQVGNLSTLGPFIFSSQYFIKPDHGYDKSFTTGGYAVFYRDISNKKMLFLSFNGSEISNDHYPQYEVIYETTDQTHKLIDYQKYFYDVAGIEHIEWEFLVYNLFCSLSMISISLSAVYLIIRELKLKMG